MIIRILRTKAPILNLLLISMGVTFASCASGPKPTENTETQLQGPQGIWTVSSVQTPESAYFDPATAHIFVSNVAGTPTEKDNQGWISRLTAEGKVIQEQWVKGLNAPKGMRAAGGTLWVTDIDRVIGIDTATAAIKHRISIKGAKFLNDIAIDSNGDVYVSDMLASRIHRIRNQKAEIFVQGPQWESPNGLMISEGVLWVAAWGMNTKPDFSSAKLGNLYRIDLRTKQKTPVTAEPLGALDGLERDADGNLLVSDWKAGKVYSIGKDGMPRVVLEGLTNPADIGYIPESRVLLVPQMGANRVTAFQR
jgi:DNA-binding beta-propeller fold protein YncE